MKARGRFQNTGICIAGISYAAGFPAAESRRFYVDLSAAAARFGAERHGPCDGYWFVVYFGVIFVVGALQAMVAFIALIGYSG